MERRSFLKATGLALLGFLHYGLGNADFRTGGKGPRGVGNPKSKIQNPKYVMSGHPGGCVPSSPQAFLREF